MGYFLAAICLFASALWLLARKHGGWGAFLLVLAATQPVDWSVQIGDKARPGTYDVIFLLFLALAARQLLRLGGRMRLSKAEAMALILPVAMHGTAILAWLLHGDNPSFAYGAWKAIRMAIYLAYILAAIVLARRSPRTQALFFKVLLVAGLIHGLIGIVQSLTHGRLLSGLRTNHRFLGFLTPIPERLLAAANGSEDWEQQVLEKVFFRAHGTINDPTWYAPAMLFVLCLWLGVALKARDRATAVKAALAYGLCSIALFFSASRGGMVAFAVVALLASLMHARKVVLALLQLSVPLTVAVAVLLLVFAPSGSKWFQLPSTALDAYQRIESIRQDQEGREEVRNLNGRTALWELALRRVAASPFIGTGKEIYLSDINWATASEGSAADDLNVPLHNQLLFCLYYHGLPCLLLFAGAYLTIVVSAYSLSKGDGLWGAMGTGIFLAGIGLAVNGLVADWSGFASATTGAGFWVCGTAAVAVKWGRGRFRERSGGDGSACPVVPRAGTIG